jgi:hypothetical protein
MAKFAYRIGKPMRPDVTTSPRDNRDAVTGRDVRAHRLAHASIVRADPARRPIRHRPRCKAQSAI